jgi:hypothetical protein
VPSRQKRNKSHSDKRTYQELEAKVLLKYDILHPILRTRFCLDEEHMSRWTLLVGLIVSAFLFLNVRLVALAQEPLTMDATKQPSPPLRGRGPFPGSTTPSHSARLPIRLELLIPTGKLRSDGTVLVDFMITNIGTDPIALPSSTDQNLGGTEILTLWLTSGAIKDSFLDLKTGQPVKLLGIVGTSAELYGRTDEDINVHVLAPNETVRVHASSRVGFRPGTDVLVAHAELLRLSHGTSELIGTADSEAVTKMLSKNVSTAR